MRLRPPPVIAPTGRQFCAKLTPGQWAISSNRLGRGKNSIFGSIARQFQGLRGLPTNEGSDGGYGPGRTISPVGMRPHRNETPTGPPPRRVVGCAGPSIRRGGPFCPPPLATLMPKKDRPPRPAQSGAPVMASAGPPERHKAVELRKAGAGRLDHDGRDLGGLRRRLPSSLRAPVLLLPACL